MKSRFDGLYTEIRMDESLDPERRESLIPRRSPAAEVDLFLQSWEQRKELANTLLKSGFLPGAFKTPEQVIAVMLKGQELGIPVMEALHGINIINGKPTVSPQLMLALVRRSRELEDIKIEHTEDSVLVTVKRVGQSAHTTEFGVNEARALNLLQKENYRKQPQTMFQWRALAANLRITFPDVIGGLYTAEEMGAEVKVTEEGEQALLETEESTHIQSDSSGEVSNEDTDSPSVDLAGTTFETFSPDKESITFGKYAGVLWSDIPLDYLEWLLGHATRREVMVKAEATLRWRGHMSQSLEPQASPLEQIFPEEPHDETVEAESKTGSEERSPYHELHADLQTVAGLHSVEQLKKWANTNKSLIDSLNEEDRSKLRQAYKQALDRAQQ